MEVLIKPLITEKMTMLTEKRNQYGFVVNRKSTKPEIKNAIEEMYKVNVLDVNTSIRPGKTKRRNTVSGLIYGKTNAFKKAIVTLKEGEKIDFYSNL